MKKESTTERTDRQIEGTPTRTPRERRIQGTTTTSTSYREETTGRGYERGGRERYEYSDLDRTGEPTYESYVMPASA